jgi:hypothetical protein
LYLDDAQLIKAAKDIPQLSQCTLENENLHDTALKDFEFPPSNYDILPRE